MKFVGLPLCHSLTNTQEKLHHLMNGDEPRRVVSVPAKFGHHNLSVDFAVLVLVLPITQRIVTELGIIDLCNRNFEWASVKFCAHPQTSATYGSAARFHRSSPPDLHCTQPAYLALQNFRRDRIAGDEPVIETAAIPVADLPVSSLGPADRAAQAVARCTVIELIKTIEALTEQDGHQRSSRPRRDEALTLPQDQVPRQRKNQACHQQQKRQHCFTSSARSFLGFCPCPPRQDGLAGKSRNSAPAGKRDTEALAHGPAAGLRDPRF